MAEDQQKAIALEDLSRAILRVPINGIGHMLKPVDEQPVKDLLSFLTTYSTSVYLSGSVRDRHFLNGDRNYADIDLLAVLGINEAINDSIIGNFTKAAKPELFFPRIPEHQRKSLNLGNTEYYVSNFEENTPCYMNMHTSSPIAPSRGIRGAFKLQPFCQYKTGIITPSPIDLVFMTGEEFEKQYRR